MISASTSATGVRPGSLYAQLLAQVRAAGLLERSATRYVLRFAALAVMCLVGLGSLLWVGDSWWQLAVAAYAGLLLAQFGFIGHDAGHQQIFRHRRWNDRFGVVMSGLGIGLSYGWWVDKHNRHHRHPNEVGQDPDVQRNVLAWTEEQAQLQGGLLRLIVRHQAAFFFPLLLFEGWNLHVGSVRTLMTKRRGRRLELTLLAMHLIGGLALLLLVMSPVKVLVFIAVQQSMFGLYLGSTFAPNHKGMLMLDGTDRPDFFHRQVLTSRNITGGPFVSAAFGGLNYQIEHHLFPSMPSRNLPRCRPLVKAFCAENDVPYTETSPLDSYRRVLTYLGDLRPRRR